MSANIISSLTEENRDLQKQIGCMNGIFQLFDRHYFVAGRRMGSSHNHKRLLQGANHSKESKAATDKAIEKKLDVAVKDKPKVSAESPRISSSSFSCTSSTLSLLDRNKTVQSGPPHSNQSNSFQSPTGTPLHQKNPSLHSNQLSVDLRDVIKDSMQREHRSLSVKTRGREEGRCHTLKHIDSPRPTQQLNSGQPRVARFDGSMRTLAKPQEAPRSSREEKNAPLQLTRKDLPRLSYDERETRDTFKSMTKLKELPRLSLDSRESSLRSSISESRLHFLQDLPRGNGNTTQMLNANQETGSNKRPSNVVVKLMGLEAFPDSKSRNEGEVTMFNSYSDGDSRTRSSERKSQRNTQLPVVSPLIVKKDPATSHLRNTSLVMKPTSNSRFPLEPAPWRQLDASRVAPKSGATSTVYGEIEKRISELEFRKSGKDLRALKQILEAMQKSRKRIEIQNQEEADLESETSKSSSDYSRSNQVTRASNHQSNQSKSSNSPKRLNISIITSKGVRSTNSSSSVLTTTDASGLQRLRTQHTLYRREDSVDKLAANDLIPRNNALKDIGPYKPCTDKKSIGKTSKTAQASRSPQLVKAANNAAFGRSSGSISPRFQGKKQGIDKQSCAINPSPDLSKGRRKTSKSPVESDSARNIKSQSTNLQRGNYRASSNNDSRNFSHQGDTASVQSESNSSLASQIEIEITSASSSIDIKKPQIKPDEKDFAARLSEDMTFAELAIPATEQPSPVSVLDPMFYREDSPSPVKKISTVFREYETPEPDELEWHLDNLNHLLECTQPKIGDEFTLKKLEKVENLVHRFILLSTTHDEASMGRIESHCRSPTPDHTYITRLLLASGLIKGTDMFLTAIQLHPSGHVINPNLFHVLEQTEQYTELANQENSRKIAPLKSDQKIHRKMLFDTVNEILVRKLTSESPFMAKRRIKTEQELLKELYSEIDHLQATQDCSLEDDHNLASIFNVDMMQQPDEWADCRGEVPALVLDIERLIFKDLITEVLTDEGLGLHDWPKRQCRKLFTQ